MAINIATKAILKILSFGGIDVEVSRQLADLKRLDPMKIFYKKMFVFFLYKAPKLVYHKQVP